MRQMNLTTKDAAKLLNVSEKTLYRWIRKGDVPAHRINEQIRFNRAEILEWATSRRIPLDPNILSEPESNASSMPTLTEALRRGSVLYRVDGRTKDAVLKQVVDQMKIPEEVDRDFLLKVLIAREALGTTAVGDGIAIPHVRSPIVLHVVDPSITLAFLESPIDFGALDEKPVTVLFTLISPTVRAHLHLLSRLAFVLGDKSVKRVIGRPGTRDEILSVIQKAEESIAAPRQLSLKQKARR